MDNNSLRSSLVEFKKSHIFGNAEVKKENYSWFANETTIEGSRKTAVENFVKGVLSVAYKSSSGTDLIAKCSFSSLLEGYISEDAWEEALHKFLRENISRRLKKTEIAKLEEWTKKDIQSFAISSQDMILSDVCTSNLLFRQVLINLRMHLIAIQVMISHKRAKDTDKTEIGELIELLEQGKFAVVAKLKKLSTVNDRVGLTIALKRYQFLEKKNGEELRSKIISILSEIVIKDTQVIRFLKDEKNKKLLTTRFVIFSEKTPRAVAAAPSNVFRFANLSTTTLLNRQFENFKLLEDTFFFDEGGLIFRDEVLPKSKCEFIKLILDVMGIQTTSTALKKYEQFLSKYDEDKFKEFLLEYPEFQFLSLISFSAYSATGMVLSTIFSRAEIQTEDQKTIRIMNALDTTYGQPFFITNAAKSPTQVPTIIHQKRYIIRNDQIELLAPPDRNSPGPTSNIVIEPTPHYYERADLSKNAKSVELGMVTPSKRGSLSRANSTGNIPRREPVMEEGNTSLKLQQLSEQKELKVAKNETVSQLPDSWAPWFTSEYDFSKNPEGVYASFLVSYTMIPVKSDADNELMKIQGKISISNLQISPSAPFEVVTHIFNTLEKIEDLKETLEKRAFIDIQHITEPQANLIE